MHGMKNIKILQKLFIIFSMYGADSSFHFGAKNPEFNKRIKLLAVICLETSPTARDKLIFTPLAGTEWLLNQEIVYADGLHFLGENIKTE
jgi:hypothetical protein